MIFRYIKYNDLKSYINKIKNIYIYIFYKTRSISWMILMNISITFEGLFNKT